MSQQNSKNDSTFRILAVLFFSLLQQSVRTVVYNCNMGTTSNVTTSEGTFKSGDAPSLCIHFLPYAIKVGFEVVVDDYIALSVRNGFYVANGHDTDVSIQLSNSQRLSQQIVS